MNGNNTRENKLVVVFGALTTIAVCLYGSAFFIRWQQQHKPRNGGVHMIVGTPEQLAESLRRTKELREKWNSWAVSHRKELAAMSSASSQNKMAFQKVYDALPTQVRRETVGFDLQDLNTGQISFSFCIGAEKFLRMPDVQKNPVVYRRFEKGADWQKGYLAHNYEVYRDIPYLRSMGTGAISYTLWASGRITESAMSAGKIDRKNPYNNITEKEVVPAL